MDKAARIFDVSRSEETGANFFRSTRNYRACRACKSIVGEVNFFAARTTLSMRILIQMASYREVATEYTRKVFLDSVLEAETKPLITDLLCIKQGGFIYISR